MSKLRTWFHERSYKHNNEPNTDWFDIEGTITRVTTNDLQISFAIRDFLKDFAIAQNSAQPQIEFHLEITDSEIVPTIIPSTAELLCDMKFLRYFQDEKCRFLHVPGSALVTADLEQGIANGIIHNELAKDKWAIAHLVFYPLWAQMLKSNFLYPLHAAGAIINDRMVLFPAASGSGKSMLSYNLLKAGFKLLADDTLILSKNGNDIWARGFPEPINFRLDVFDVFPELNGCKNINYHERRQRMRFYPDKEFPGCYVDRAIPKVILFPQLTDQAESRLEPISKPEALQGLFLSSIFFVDKYSSGHHVKLLSELLSGVECYRLMVGRDNIGLSNSLTDFITKLG